MSYCIFVMAFIGNIILISVGFDIVCPRRNGNAKAKTSGMGKSQNPALFLSLFVNILIRMIESWNEIYESIKRNPLRAVMTGLGVAWGIFILILLVGVGNGIQKGTMSLFDGFSRTTTYVFAQKTTSSKDGTLVGTRVTFDEADLMNIPRSITSIAYISPEVSRVSDVYEGLENARFQVRGILPDYFSIKLIKLKEGRLLNTFDESEKRNVAIIGNGVAKMFFEGESPIGKHLQIDSEIFTVIGLITDDLLSTGESRNIYIPYSTFALSNASARHFSTLVYSLQERTPSSSVNRQVNAYMAQKYNYDILDDKVLLFDSMEEQVNVFGKLFSSMKKFLWFMGVSVLISGAIGVGNMMFTSVRERTREMGIRKAVGARPSAIKKMIIGESVAITLFSGCIGILLGCIGLKGLSLLLGNETTLKIEPNIDMAVVLASLFILILAGVLAGLKPAVDAADIEPIEALKESF